MRTWMQRGCSTSLVLISSSQLSFTLISSMQSNGGSCRIMHHNTNLSWCVHGCLTTAFSASTSLHTHLTSTRSRTYGRISHVEWRNFSVTRWRNYKTLWRSNGRTRTKNYCARSRAACPSVVKQSSTRKAIIHRYKALSATISVNACCCRFHKLVYLALPAAG